MTKNKSDKSKKRKPTASGKGRAKPQRTVKKEDVASETRKARVREQWEEVLKELEEEYGAPCASCHQDDHLQVLDEKHVAKLSLRELEEALARPAIGFKDSEILKRCDGVVKSPMIRTLPKAKRLRLLECREKLAARTQQLEIPQEERMFMALAEALLQAERTEASIQRDARSSSNTARANQILLSLRKTKRKTYRFLRGLLDELEEPAFCRCVETFWDYWVHGGPAEFHQDVNVRHLADTYPLLQAEAKRQRKTKSVPSLEEYANGMRETYPGRTALSEGLVNGSYGFVIPLPLRPCHIAKYVTSRHRKQWYVTWMQWYLSYRATVYPRTVYWRKALAASFEPLVGAQMKKAIRAMAKWERPLAERKALVPHIRNCLEVKLVDAVKKFNFFYRQTLSVGGKRMRLPPPPRSAPVLGSIEIPFTAHIEDKLRGELHNLLKDYAPLPDWSPTGPVDIGDAEYWPEDLETEGLSIISPPDKNYAQEVEVDGVTYLSRDAAAKRLGVHPRTLLRRRQSFKIKAYRWRDLSRGARRKDLRGGNRPPPSWWFYRADELDGLRRRKRRGFRRTPKTRPQAEC